MAAYNQTRGNQHHPREPNHHDGKVFERVSHHGGRVFERINHHGGGVFHRINRHDGMVFERIKHLGRRA